SLIDPSATWLLFFDQEGASVWSTGDVFTIEYVNPLQAGVDVYRFQSVPTTSIGGEVAIPEKFALSQNYPNPFNPVTTIKYELPFTSDVKFIIYNLLGQEVFRLEQFAQQAGEHLVRWNGRNMQGSELSSGIYFYRLQAGEFVQTRKMVLLK
ncbi:T9SS type A sorting domain-containing protein, partial [Candidatus Marinimicrobia bacterium MT.SAG.3]